MHRGENGSTDVIRDEPARDHGQIGAGLKDSVNSGETAAAERPEIANDAVSVEVLRECIAYAHDVGCADRIRIKSDQRNSVGLRVGAGALARAFDRLADCARSQRELDLAFTGTRDREHQRGCITKIALELDRAGAARKIVDAIELQVDVVELFCGILEFFIQLNVDNRDTVEGYRSNAVESACASRMDERVLRDAGLDLPRHHLLDLLRADAGPRTNRNCLAHGNIGILALRHLRVSEDTPDQDAH